MNSVRDWQADDEGMADNIRGELWVFLRDLLAQGGHIRDDYHGKTYESYAARLDAAARERTNELEQMLATREHK